MNYKTLKAAAYFCVALCTTFAWGADEAKNLALAIIPVSGSTQVYNCDFLAPELPQKVTFCVCPSEIPLSEEHLDKIAQLRGEVIERFRKKAKYFALTPQERELFRQHLIETAPKGAVMALQKRITDELNAGNKEKALPFVVLATLLATLNPEESLLEAFEALCLE